MCSELTDSFWVGSVQVEVNNNPAFMKVIVNEMCEFS